MRASNILTRLALPAVLTLAAAACESNPTQIAAGDAALDEIAVAAANDVQLREVTLPSGVRLQYAETGHADGEPIIMLHGYTDSWYSYARVLPELAPKYRGISITQRGHGDSDRPGSYTGDDFAADVDGLMQALGIERATIVGHSMGSFVAQTVAIRYPHRVKKLVLIGSAAVAGNEILVGLNDFVQTLTDPVDSTFVYEFQASTIYYPVPQPFLDTVVQESRKLPAQVWKDALAAAIPNATLSVYPETGHAPHWERPGDFAKELEKFVKKD